VRFLAYNPPDSGPHCEPNGNQVIPDILVEPGVNLRGGPTD
jgi:hypothetical protein